MKPSWAGIVASLLVMCASSAASAVSAVSAAPACFPERITLGRIGIFDGAGELFGFVEENQTVRVLAAGVGLAGRYSQVELKVPERIVGYVQNDRLAVVAGRDIPIQPGLSWCSRGRTSSCSAEMPGMPKWSARYWTTTKWLDDMVTCPVRRCVECLFEPQHA
jgi:hypothetical protein